MLALWMLIRSHFILNTSDYTGTAIVGNRNVQIIVESSQEIILTDISGNTYSKRYTNRAGQVKSDDYVNVIAKEYIKEVFLGDGITRIGSQAFNSCTALTKVTSLAAFLVKEKYPICLGLIPCCMN